MIIYDHLPLDPEMLDALAKLKVDYVFQPIFMRDGKTIYAREALMRPEGKKVSELIEEYAGRGELHTLEVATFWGATQAYFMRGYTEKLSVNSFPCECFSTAETKSYVDFFGQDKNILIIESLEYPYFDEKKSMLKRKVAAVGDSQLALDDYGTGINDMDMVDKIQPSLVKLDKTLLRGIHCDREKQIRCKSIIDDIHSRGKKVIAEGVECREEFEYLIDLGADLFQGYYLAEPA